VSFFSLRHHKDLPLDQDPGTKYLPWLIAFMVYLAALSVVGTSIIQSLGQRWENGVSDTLSIQIPPAQAVAQDQKNIENIVTWLRQYPGVIQAQPVAKDRVMALLEPWLGSPDVLAQMPIPHLIDVSVERGVQIDGAELVRQLDQIVAGASVDDHRIWLERLINMSRSMEMGAYVILGLIVFASIGTVYFVTRTGLAIHHEVIEVLHLIGAQDSYIARQFAEHSMSLAFRGGFIGLAVAGPTFGVFAYFYRQAQSSLLPQIDITPVQWVVILALPFLSAFMGYVTARSAVLKTLKKMV
jgi:cell division transport system permease protein